MSTAHTVYFVNSVGGRVASVLDMGNVIERFAGSVIGARLLPVLDPHEDAIFTSSQMPAFLDEWRMLSDILVDDEDRQFARELEKLAECTLSQPGSTLLFEGD